MKDINIEKIVLEQLCTDVAKIEPYRNVTVIFNIATGRKTGRKHPRKFFFHVPSYITNQDVTHAVKTIWHSIRYRGHLWKKSSLEENINEVSILLQKETEDFIAYNGPALQPGFVHF